jgi:hypothetical protein
MQQPRGDFLAAARGADDQHPAARGRHALDLLARMIDRRGLPSSSYSRPGPAAQLFVLALEAGRLDGAVHDEQQAVGLEGLFHEVIGAELDRLDRGFDIAMAADHDHRQVRVLALDDAQGLEPVEGAALQPDIEDHHRRTPGADRLERAVAIGRFARLVALVLEDSRDEQTDVRFIVDDQNVTRHEP